MKPGLEAKLSSKTALFTLNILLLSIFIHLSMYNGSDIAPGSGETSVNEIDEEPILVAHTF